MRQHATFGGQRRGDASSSRRGQSPGFTLPEMMVAIAVAAILLALAVPSFVEITARNQLRNAVERVRTDLTLARSEALRRNHSVTLTFKRNSSNDWCYGLTMNASCDCYATSGSTVCALDTGVSNVVSAANFGASIQSLALPYAGSSGSVTFSPARPTISGDSFRFSSSKGEEARAVLAPNGRIRLCSPTGSSKSFYFDPC